jgi:cell fate (sporulation/competence/biofilm development) regulator YlbF (YheA/YmcA/DUF963 family)
MNHFDMLELQEDAEKILKDIQKFKSDFNRMLRKPEQYDTSELMDLSNIVESVQKDWEYYILDTLETCRKENWRAMRESIRT